MADDVEALAIQDLTVRYHAPSGPVDAVGGISTAIARGQCVGLVGESGSGKSTVGAAAQGLLTRDPAAEIAGSIAVSGTRLDPAREDGWASVRGHAVTTVFQDPMSSLDPTMTIGRMLTLVTGDHDESCRWLEEVEIRSARGVMRSYPHQLSGGMRQRVLIAMALARRPALLIADEPTTALDVSVQAQILRLLNRERESLGFGILFVTHDLGVARHMCDDIAVMRRGRVVERGHAATIFAEPAEAYTKRLVGSRLTLATDRERPMGPPEPTIITAMCEAPALRGGESGGAAPGEDKLAARWEDASLRWSEFAPSRTDADTPPVLTVREVRKTFRTGGLFGSSSKSALHGVDLTVRRRESVSLVGESGSGKSTILRITAGLERADSGTVELEDADGIGVQLVPQAAGSSLTPWLSVEQLLMERLMNTAEGKGLDRTARRGKLCEALERVALEPDQVLSARPPQLSGGQRQRVAIARAIVVPPALLLCDEPTSAIDVSVACSVLNLLNLLRHQLGLSILFVTHDLAAARVIADRVVVINDGRIVEQVGSGDLAATMTSDYSRRLLDAVLV